MKIYTKNIQRTMLGIMRLVILATLGFAVLFQSWSSVFLIFVSFFMTFAPIVIERRTRYHLPVEVHFLFVFFVFITVFLGSAQGFYVVFWWWDAFLHTVFGVVVSFFGFLVFYLLYVTKKVQMSPFFIAVTVFAYASMFALLWEIFEFFMDVFLGTQMQSEAATGVTDTMTDLVVSSVGALLVCMLAYLSIKWRGRRSHDKPLGFFDAISEKFVLENKDT